jgi:hypothetical protein
MFDELLPMCLRFWVEKDNGECNGQIVKNGTHKIGMQSFITRGSRFLGMVGGNGY